MRSRVLIAPSVLSANFGELAAGVRLAEKMGGDYVHLDVMDGAFVPNITFGPKAVADLRPVSALPFDVHLMIQRPEAYVDEFARAGADIITVHLEASTHLHRLLSPHPGAGQAARRVDRALHARARPCRRSSTWWTSCSS